MAEPAVNQYHVLNQLIRYKSVVEPGHIATGIHRFNEGACQGFAAAHAYMAATGHLDWWHWALSQIAGWNGMAENLDVPITFSTDPPKYYTDSATPHFDRVFAQGLTRLFGGKWSLETQAPEAKCQTLGYLFERLFGYILKLSRKVQIGLYIDKPYYAQFLPESGLFDPEDFKVNSVCNMVVSLESEAFLLLFSEPALRSKDNIIIVNNFVHSTSLRYSGEQACWFFYNPESKTGEVAVSEIELKSVLMEQLGPNLSIDLVSQSPKEDFEIKSLIEKYNAAIVDVTIQAKLEELDWRLVARHAPETVQLIVDTLLDGEEEGCCLFFRNINVIWQLSIHQPEILLSLITQVKQRQMFELLELIKHNLIHKRYIGGINAELTAVTWIACRKDNGWLLEILKAFSEDRLFQTKLFEALGVGTTAGHSGLMDLAQNKPRELLEIVSVYQSHPGLIQLLQNVLALNQHCETDPLDLNHLFIMLFQEQDKINFDLVADLFEVLLGIPELSTMISDSLLHIPIDSFSLIEFAVAKSQTRLIDVLLKLGADPDALRGKQVPEVIQKRNENTVCYLAATEQYAFAPAAGEAMRKEAIKDMIRLTLEDPGLARVPFVREIYTSNVATLAPEVLSNFLLEPSIKNLEELIASELGVEALAVIKESKKRDQLSPEYFGVLHRVNPYPKLFTTRRPIG